MILPIIAFIFAIIGLIIDGILDNTEPNFGIILGFLGYMIYIYLTGISLKEEGKLSGFIYLGDIYLEKSNKILFYIVLIFFVFVNNFSIMIGLDLLSNDLPFNNIWRILFRIITFQFSTFRPLERKYDEYTVTDYGKFTEFSMTMFFLSIIFWSILIFTYYHISVRKFRQKILSNTLETDATNSENMF